MLNEETISVKWVLKLVDKQLSVLSPKEHINYFSFFENSKIDDIGWGCWGISKSLIDFFNLLKAIWPSYSKDNNRIPVKHFRIFLTIWRSNFICFVLYLLSALSYQVKVPLSIFQNIYKEVLSKKKKKKKAGQTPVGNLHISYSEKQSHSNMSGNITFIS